MLLEYVLLRKTALSTNELFVSLSNNISFHKTTMLHLRCRVLNLFAILGCLVQLQAVDMNFITLNTTCKDVTIKLLQSESDIVRIPDDAAITLKLELSTLLEPNPLTLYHSETSRNELSFHQIAVGSRVTHELGIEVFHTGNVTWDIQFINNNPRLSGFYEIDIGGCRTKNITVYTPIMSKLSGSALLTPFTLTIPEISLKSLNLICSFELNYFNLALYALYLNGSEVRTNTVFSDSLPEILSFSPILLDPSITTPGPYTYQCTASNFEFQLVYIQLFIDSSELSYAEAKTAREGDRMSIDLEAICQPFYSRFNFTLEDGNTSNTFRLSFTMDGTPFNGRNLTLAKLEYNGTFSCHVQHTLFEAQTEILELYVKPLNICAHSNGGCDHECSTYLGADSFNCSCRRGYRLSSNKLGCEDINECLFPFKHSCSNPSERCVNQPAGSYSCECAEGFTQGSRGCEDVEECELGTAECMHECKNTPGGYTCSCRPGYTLIPVDNSTCIGTPLESPSFLITPVILASVFGIVLVLSIAVILILVVAVCKRNRRPTRLKYEMFTKRLSGDFKCHQQVDNPVFRLDQGSIFTKRISPRKNAGAYGILREFNTSVDLIGETRPRSANYRPRSLEQAALSDGGLTTETDDLSDDVMLPKPLTARHSPSTILRHDSTQSIPKSKNSSPLHRPTKTLPHSNMVPVLPFIGDQFPLRNLRSHAETTSTADRNFQLFSTAK